MKRINKETIKKTNENKKISSLPDVLIPADLQFILNVSIETVYNLLKTKKIKSFKIGRGYRIYKKHLIEYISQL
ncbi:MULTISPECIES: helix-turn-helix domain-containing protein [unclassified Fusobacterium]|uniref:helix-turn-helix domain-containing protein n=1 Tax=unclassified Fusobacterium TaxID=2648384 RepID=UPI001B8D879F|nr:MULTISPECIES: helix-turn-helix domain-containing protein [unclassified Fusobacterium]MBR8700506.1 hypothetical protein [Fusobacterium sp. DD45]MBR8710229.1 hypothetical protein [Fusobacterium sp. DD28]MBR8750751.1 hypothetical protein [Fusobacterium sp. DD26]